MKTKKFIFINSIIIFSLAAISHFVYEYLPNNFTAIFFPVNESIWEHMKLLYTPFIIDIIILYITFKKLNIVYHNLALSALISSIFSIFVYLIIYLPVFVIFGNNLIFDIILLFLVIIGSQILQLYILKKEASDYTNFSIIMIILIYIIFGFLTYFPPRNFMFYDYSENKYGRNIYVLGN